MIYRRLGRTDIQVSALCLGTMTWGEQNSEAEAHEQLDAALAAGINFIDTAEMYPVPPKADTYGLTEQYIGNWLQAARQPRQGRPRHQGPGPLRLPRPTCATATRASTARISRPPCTTASKRLQTDYVDLYQLHWPDRRTNFFGQLGYTPAPDEHSGAHRRDPAGAGRPGRGRQGALHRPVQRDARGA